MTTMRKLALAAVCAAGLGLAACGGDDFNNSSNTLPVTSDTPPVTSEVPASASATVGGFIDYLMKLVVASADMLEPVDVAAVTAPTDETGEPTPLP